MNTRLVLFLILATVLAGCEIEGGVPTPTPAAPAASIAAPTAPAPVAAPSADDPVNLLSETGLRIGLVTEPLDLLPYFTDPADERATAVLSELIFPAPLLAQNYQYTTTGILDMVPSRANGDLDVTPVEVFVAPDGTLSSEPTDVITTVQQVSVIFRWNRNLTWADGTPLTAQDSLFAYELAQRVSLGQEAEARLALIERYEVIDDYTTQAVLKPDFTDPAYLTTFWPPLPRHLLADLAPEALYTSDYALMPLGYGPYLIARRETGRIRLERNPHWRGPQPAADTLTFIFREDADLLASSVAGGSLDLAFIDQPEPTLLSSLQASAAAGAFQLLTTPGPIWEHLDFNLDVPLYQDIRIRRAVAHAINRQAMIDQLAAGASQPLDSWILPEQPFAAPSDQLTTYPYNPDEARRLLDEAGWVDNDGDGLRDRDGAPLALRLLTTENTPVRLAAAEQIRADLAAISVSLTIEQTSVDALYSFDGPLFRRQFEMALFAWIATPDPRGWERWSCAGVPSEANNWTGNNFPGWCFFEADRAIRIATTALEPEVRAAAYFEQQQLFSQELPVLPLFRRTSVVIVAPTLQGVDLDATAPLTWRMSAWQR